MATKKKDVIAVIAASGRQYVVQEGEQIKVDQMADAKIGDALTFDEVLLTHTGDKTTVGAPNVKGAKVTAKVVAHGRYDKVMGVKMKAKKRHKKLFGHKQPFTQLEVEKITVK